MTDEPEYEFQIVQLTFLDSEEEGGSLHDFIMEMCELHGYGLEEMNDLLDQCAIKARVDIVADDDDDYDDDYESLTGDYDG